MHRFITLFGPTSDVTNVINQFDFHNIHIRDSKQINWKENFSAPATSQNKLDLHVLKKIPVLARQKNTKKKRQLQFIIQIDLWKKKLQFNMQISSSLLYLELYIFKM